MNYAAIDVGTNAARLLIGEVVHQDGKSFVKKVSYTRIPLRLGEEVFEDGKISKKKVQDFINTIKAFGLIASLFDVKRLRAVATSAMRESKNGQKIVDKIKEETGITLEVIPGDIEAELIFGTFFLLEIEKEMPFIVIDVGGGSTEVSVFEKGERIASKSFEIGTIRLLKEKVDKNIWSDIHEWMLQHVDLSDQHQLFGTGGNINKAHKIIGVKDNKPVRLSQLENLKRDLSALSLDQRMSEYQLKPDRADVIVPALEIFTYIMKEMGATEIIVPKIGLSDGMIYAMYKEDLKK
ncbi:MAG: exopolyphosphatase [Flavobacteriales bacterium]|nr:exopolyphosphatase [Flavobacteriales bacterium]